jgi:hypothetical protein
MYKALGTLGSPCAYCSVGELQRPLPPFAYGMDKYSMGIGGCIYCCCCYCMDDLPCALLLFPSPDCIDASESLLVRRRSIFASKKRLLMRTEANL